MSVPAWVRIGEKCVCIDGCWWDDVGSGNPDPVLGSAYVITSVFDRGDCAFLGFSDPSLGGDLFSVDGFRPLTQFERDVDLFAIPFTGAAASPRRELVPA
jgi:hypothetical protein